MSIKSLLLILSLGSFLNANFDDTLRKANRLISGGGVDIGDNNGDRLLHVVTSLGYFELVRLLLKSGADTEVANNIGCTPFHTAVQALDVKVLNLLLESGSNKEAENIHGDRPFHYAVSFGYIEIIKWFLVRGVDVNAINKKGNSPLHRAVKARQYEAVKLLLAVRADTEITNNKGMRPVDIARGRSLEILRSIDPYGHPDVTKAKQDLAVFESKRVLDKTLKESKGVFNYLFKREAGLRVKY